MSDGNPIRVLIVDDQGLMLEGLSTLLDLEPDLDVVGTAGDGSLAVEAYERLSPDVVLMDVQMPNMDGVEATRRIIARSPDAKIIILTTFDTESYIYEGIRAGAVGYLLKASKGAELAAAIRTVVSGGSLLDPSVARKLMSEFARIAPGHTNNAALSQPLSEREMEILAHIGEGLSNVEIADTMHLAEGTVKNYVTNILAKLDVRDRTQAALRARDLGILG